MIKSTRIGLGLLTYIHWYRHGRSSPRGDQQMEPDLGYFMTVELSANF